MQSLGKSQNQKLINEKSGNNQNNQKNEKSKNQQLQQKQPKKQSKYQLKPQMKQTSFKKANRIIAKCIEQHTNFKQWHQRNHWQTFHSSHYDWWAFPIDERSSYGDTYQVQNEEINVMKDYVQFLKVLSENARMVCQAWGYDLREGHLIQTQHRDQRWHNWPIRLYKMTKSLEIFGLHKQFQNAVKYGNMLINEGKNFIYSRRELGKYFILKKEQIKQRENIKETKQTNKKDKQHFYQGHLLSEKQKQHKNQ